MPTRITNVALTLHRGNGRIDISAGSSVDLTDEELRDIRLLNPNAVRLPIDEVSVQPEIAPETTPSQGSDNSNTGKNSQDNRKNKGGKQSFNKSSDDDDL